MSDREFDERECAYLAGRIGRRAFIAGAMAAGLSVRAARAASVELDTLKQAQAARSANLDTSYDYIVCGAGSSGCVVASRLVRSGKRVLLVEAGGWDDLPAILDPRVHFTNLGTATDWNFPAEPEPGMGGRAPLQHMGRVLGGGSSINAMIWAHGHRNDYDYWARAANDQRWGGDAALTMWRRIESWQGARSAFRGVSGPMWVEASPNPNPVALALLDAANAKSYPVVGDLNAERTQNQGGFGLQNHTVRAGQRRNVAVSYVYPVLARPNLTLSLRTTVERLTIERGRVTGVRLRRDDGVHEIRAGDDVVLSLGAINTPKVLMLSGIGNAAMLRSFGIGVVADLPEVGRNLQDHILHGGVLLDAPNLAPYQYGTSVVAGFLKSRSDLQTPDINIVQAEAPYASPEVAAKYPPTKTTWALATGLVGPKSRGQVTLRSANPIVPPMIATNMLSEPEDLTALLRGIEVCRELAATREMRPFVRREVAPGPTAGRLELVAFARLGTLSYQHESGTCRMGADSGSVVDAALSVRGVDGLRIADGSIMPRIVHAPTMATCVMIGEVAADIILGNSE